MSEMTTRVVRAIGSGRMHVVTVPDTALGEWEEFGVPFTGIALPLICRCGTTLRGRVAVCMAPGTRVNCTACRHVTGIITAADHNMQREEVG